MDRFVTPGARELEYLACIVERAAMVRTEAGWSQWSQGLLQMLLPHQAMVCLRSGGDGRPAQALCLHPPGMDAARMAQLCALAQRLVLACRGGLPWALPEVADADVDGGDGAAAPTPLRRDLAKLAPGATLLHGTGALASGAVWFIVFGMPRGRAAVSRYYLELLLPSLYLLSQRLAAQPLAEPLTEPLTEP
ncbi:MAG: hypothetical protein K2X55_00955, partial [Burkholderiaceae bacterium]|nr:hypothetical protein [Burkholderiaceae bacterium]